jgi:predicted RNase H-like nuclease (RuvC/YqgF family)
MADDKKVEADASTDDTDLDVEEPEGSKTYDAEYVRKLKAEAKSYRQDKAQLKKEFEETKKKLEALESEKLTDAEKKEKRITELEKILADKDSAIKNKEIEALITEAISDKGIVDKDVAKLLIRAELDGEEDINSKAVERVVEKIIKEKPYLIASGSANPSSGNFAKKDNNAAPKDGVEVLKKFVGGYVK